MITFLTVEANELVHQTLVDAGGKSLRLEWRRCPACGAGEPWRPGNSHTGIPWVCYPCGLLALAAEAEDAGQKEFARGLMARYDYAVECERADAPAWMKEILN